MGIYFVSGIKINISSKHSGCANREKNIWSEHSQEHARKHTYHMF